MTDLIPHGMPDEECEWLTLSLMACLMRRVQDWPCPSRPVWWGVWMTDLVPHGLSDEESAGLTLSLKACLMRRVYDWPCASRHIQWGMCVTDIVHHSMPSEECASLTLSIMSFLMRSMHDWHCSSWHAWWRVRMTDLVHDGLSDEETAWLTLSLMACLMRRLHDWPCPSWPAWWPPSPPPASCTSCAAPSPRVWSPPAWTSCTIALHISRATDPLYSTTDQSSENQNYNLAKAGNPKSRFLVLLETLYRIFCTHIWFLKFWSNKKYSDLDCGRQFFVFLNGHHHERNIKPFLACE